MTATSFSSAPRVSVVMIFYNAGRYFDEAILSVRRQTMDDWELILVDDGSSDGSTAIAERHVAADPARVRLVSHPNGENRGMSASRNLGLSRARGEFVSFLDADDIWECHQLAQQVELLDEHPEAGAVYGRIMNWFSWPGSPWRDAEDYATPLPFCSGEVIQPPFMLPTVVKDGGPYGYFFGMGSFMVRRSYVEAFGGFNEQFRGNHEDNVFHVKLFLSTPVLVSDECWGWYRQHPNSTYQRSLRSVRARIEADVRFANWLLSYLPTVNVGDSLVEDQTIRWAERRRTVWKAILFDPVYTFGYLLPRRVRRKLRPMWRVLSRFRSFVLERPGTA